MHLFLIHLFQSIIVWGRQDNDHDLHFIDKEISLIWQIYTVAELGL